MKDSILGVLGIVFVVLKLAEVGVVANWSWWLVLLPFYIWSIPVVVVVLVAIISFVISYYTEENKRNNKK